MGATSRFALEFEEWAATYDATVAAGSDVFQGYEGVLDAVAAEVAAADGSRVADIGAGTGNLAARLRMRRLHVTAVDPSAAMRANLTRKVPGIGVLAGDFQNLPKDMPLQDAIVASFSFHHVAPAKRRQVLRALGDLLAPSGQIVIADVAFAGRMVRQRIFDELATTNRQDLLSNMRSEFYPTVDVMLAALHDAGFMALARQLTPWVWLFTARRGRLELGLDDRVARPIHGLRAEEDDSRAR